MSVPVPPRPRRTVTSPQLLSPRPRLAPLAAPSAADPSAGSKARGKERKGSRKERSEDNFKPSLEEEEQQDQFWGVIPVSAAVPFIPIIVMEPATDPLSRHSVDEGRTGK